MNHNLNKALLFSLSIIILLFVDDTSVKSYLYTLGLIILSSHFLFKNLSTKAFYYFHTYLLVAVLLFITFKNQSPLYQGLTGEGIADDARFYSQIVGGKNIAFNITASLDEIFPFAKLLKFLYPFSIQTPLNIVILNLFFITLLPIYVYLLTETLFEDEKIAQTASYLSFLCPFTMYFGCIILREGIIASLLVAGMYYFLKKQYWLLLFCILGISFIRFGSVLFLLTGLLCLYRIQLVQMGRKCLFNWIIILIFILIVFIFPYLPELTGGKFSGNLYRETGDFWEGSTIGGLTKLPFPFNVVSTTLFFIYIPFLSFPKTVEGLYLAGSFFQGIFTPIFMLFIWEYVYNAVLSARKGYNEYLYHIVLYVLMSAFLLGTVSLQSRHKIMLFPFICILGAYGMVNYSKREHKLTMLLYAITLIANIVFFTNSI